MPSENGLRQGIHNRSVGVSPARPGETDKLQFAGVPGDRMVPPGSDDAPAIRLVNSLLARGVAERASDIHFEPQEQGMRVRFRIDGLLHQVAELPRELSYPVVSRIKVMAKLDIAERRLPQDGRTLFVTEGKRLDLRVSTIDTVFGEKVVIRILDQGSIHRYTLASLGFTPGNQALLEKFLASPCGMVLVTGPTGSGKTTTLYTALKLINSSERNIVTVEDPVEYILPGVNQTQVNVKAGATFATYLRSIVRQDPDVIMVGEIRDRETAGIAVRAATTGHLVLSTLHTNDAAGSLTRLVDMGIEPFMVAGSVLGVVSQRLVRRVCPHCSLSYTPDAGELYCAGAAAERAGWLRGQGCPACRGTGYLGRVALHELLEVTTAIKELIVRGVPAGELRQAALQEGMTPIRVDGINKAAQGITTLAEVLGST